VQFYTGDSLPQPLALPEPNVSHLSDLSLPSYPTTIPIRSSRKGT